MEEINVWYEKMVVLIAHALHGTAPEREQVENLDLAALYKLAAAHSLTAVVCMALEAADAFSMADPEVKKRWTDAKNKAIRKNMLLDAERERILKEMERAGIWYMPLKGSVLKELYPRYGMRQMADNDILFDPAGQREVMHLFLKRGYKAKVVGRGNHDVYLKPPVYNFEMHTALFGSAHPEGWAAYYRDVKERLHPDEGKKFGYHFTDEDFYIYITAHAYKHYSICGTGIRSLLDLFVFNWKKGKTLDREYVRAELQKLGIAEFEEKSRCLAEKMFGAAVPLSELALTKEEREMLAYYCGSGTYGTAKLRVKNKLRKLQGDEGPITVRTKLHYFCLRLFPGREWCREPYPLFYRYPFLIPALWMYRIVRSAVFYRKRLGDEIRMVKSPNVKRSGVDD